MRTLICAFLLLVCYCAQAADGFLAVSNGVTRGGFSGGGGAGDVTQAGQNNFSGSNSLSGVTVFLKNGVNTTIDSNTITSGTMTLSGSGTNYFGANVNVNGTVNATGYTNSGAIANQFAAWDGNKAITSTLNASVLTNVNNLSPGVSNWISGLVGGGISTTNIYIDAGAMIGPLTSSAQNVTYSPANSDLISDGWSFVTGATNAVQFKLAMPLNWDGDTNKMALTLFWACQQTNWTSATNVIWCWQTAPVPTGTNLNAVNFQTLMLWTNSMSTNLNIMESGSSVPPFMTNGAAGRMTWFRLARLGDNAQDTVTNAVILLGAQMKLGLQ